MIRERPIPPVAIVDQLQFKTDLVGGQHKIYPEPTIVEWQNKGRVSTDIRQAFIIPEDFENYVVSLFGPEEEHFLLRDTGFEVTLQIGTYLQIYNAGIVEGKTIEEINSEFRQKTTQDLLGFYLEYLAREPVLPIEVDIVESDRKRNVVSTKYGGRPLSEVISDREREGAIKSAIEKLSSLLLNAPANSIYVITSPSGWSGLIDENGQELKFPESQTYLYRVDENGELEAITVRTNMSLEEHERFITRLSENIHQTPDGLSTKERIKKVTSTVSFLPNSQFSDVLKVMQEVKQSNTAWVDKSTGKRITFDDIRDAIKNKDQLLDLDKRIQLIIDNFCRFTENLGEVTTDSIKDLAIQIGKTVMEMSWAMNQLNNTQTISPYSDLESQIDYQLQAQVVQQFTGCVAVGSILETPLGIRKLCCTCPYCNNEVEAEIHDGKIHCPKCGKSVNWP
jgi:hypothetical protein